MAKRRLPIEEYTVGWVSALPIELAAATSMLVEEHSDPPRDNHDTNLYTLGRIVEHNVVLACLPAGQTGNNSAAAVAAQMMMKFTSIRFGVMVGIGGGVPNAESDVRLGDVVISQPYMQHGGVVQYDLGKTEVSGFMRTGSLNTPPTVLLNALAKFRSNRLLGKSTLAKHLAATSDLPHFTLARAGADILFEPTYNHVGGPTCDSCSRDRLVERPARDDQDIVVHYGTIASGNQVMKDAVRRDRLSSELGGVLCFEMEAAGLMNSFPCLVIRGVCDYADSHKNKSWQGYAAATAAACAKEILSIIPKADVTKTRALDEAIGNKDGFEMYQIPSTLLRDVTAVNKFVDRPSEMTELERVLLPQKPNGRRKILFLHGLGGIGKTQLAIEFARRHAADFSSVFWLDGRTEDTLKQSIATSATRIPKGQISESARTYAMGKSGDLDIVVKEVVNWLSTPENTRWLLVLDNVDRGFAGPQAGGDVYDVNRYFPGSDHGSILVTTRLSSFGQLGSSLKLERVDSGQARAIFENGYRKSFEDSVHSRDLLRLLDGLPLALAQASAFMRETGTTCAEYIKFYNEQWAELMETADDSNIPLPDYPNGSIMTTWNISFKAIQKKDELAAKLLQLWAHLDNRDLWFELFVPTLRICSYSDSVPKWFQEIASHKLKFKKTIKFLLDYSMADSTLESSSYATHPVVHVWALQTQNEEVKKVLGWLAFVVVGLAVPHTTQKDYWTLQRRLLPHAECCLLRPVAIMVRKEVSQTNWSAARVLFSSFHCLGDLYADQDKFTEAEKWYIGSIEGKLQVLVPEHPSTLDTMSNLGGLLRDHGKLKEAEWMYRRALDGKEKTLGPEHTSTLYTVHNLGNFYAQQDKLEEAEKMYMRALAGKEKTLGLEDVQTLSTVGALGNLYLQQGKLEEAEDMMERALKGYVKALGPEHPTTLTTVSNLGNLYVKQGKLNEAEQSYFNALEGLEKTVSLEHKSTLSASHNLISFLMKKSEIGKESNEGEPADDAQDSVTQRVNKVLTEQLSVNPDVLADEVSLLDLKADNLDLVEIPMGLEDEFGLEIDESDLKFQRTTTVGEIKRYIKRRVEQNGGL